MKKQQTWEEANMTERQMRKLNRTELLEALLAQKQENEALNMELQRARTLLKNRQLTIDQAGSLAEAALKLNGVFEAAEAACRQYTENIRMLSGRQEEICRRMELDTRVKCEKMVTDARQMARLYWEEYADQYASRMDAAEMEEKGSAEPLPTEPA